MESNRKILTIAIPTYNMERWLENNLNTYCSSAVQTRLEVLVMNNASTDGSKAIIEKFCHTYPEIFILHDRSSRGYGSSINEAIASASGRFFRIIDADDWVDTAELERFISYLETCTADVVISDYEIVSMKNGDQTPVKAGDKGISYYKTFTDFEACKAFSPSIHSTTYRTDLLRHSGFSMQDNIFYVDEEYITLPFLAIKTSVFTDCNVYRYQVANPEQSMSPQNRAKYRDHRAKVLMRLIDEYKVAKQNNVSDAALSYFFHRIERGVGDHFTTLYMYVKDRKQGRVEAKEWREYVITTYPSLWELNKAKARKLLMLNMCSIGLDRYERLKRLMGYGG